MVLARMARIQPPTEVSTYTANGTRRWLSTSPKNSAVKPISMPGDSAPRICEIGMTFHTAPSINTKRSARVNWGSASITAAKLLIR